MPKRVFRIRQGEPLLDIVSYGRAVARGGGGRLTAEQVQNIRRTVQRVPEAVVKVLSRPSSDMKAAAKHLDYISRYGHVELETDDGDHLEVKKGVARALLDDWDLDIDQVRRQSELTSTKRSVQPRIIHKLVFSMPSGTPPDKVLAAVRNFAREEFWGQHRYAIALHTDEDHPHVHLVLKAMSEQGVRLNIRKATLRHWRSEFARNLRLLGVQANATERAVRGETIKAKKDGVYRASLRGDSTHLREQAEAVACELLKGGIRVEGSQKTLAETRSKVVNGWLSVADYLASGGERSLAGEVRQYVERMPPVRTEREWIAHALSQHLPSAKHSSRPKELHVSR